jgi:hypothetical protein
VAAQQIQPITYIIGINKLGTLLSSQTTDTPGTTQTNIPFRIAPEQLFKLTRSPTAKQIRYFRIHIEEKTAPTDFQRPEEQPDSGFDLGVLATR